ncbi:uncharacterized protein PHALS_03104 [Plasmopara halstedii]|uniref:Uncharacterized protein n=1 Tax=Plasmopara halstedii TaxID=4781 RepID=A0A0P1A8Q6_PLAHL|nr:uncharacterized protein PHALS_03104 [Plasmopara halstedii]CEG36556.1 hypothetical protein PHALS_03104 [Plasmopara halstedii]|eukprot:XP_024572925.1 hypothetical protein PHALS_03104 [Plasmopara halstedii]
MVPYRSVIQWTLQEENSECKSYSRAIQDVDVLTDHADLEMELKRDLRSYNLVRERKCIDLGKHDVDEMLYLMWKF